MLGRWSIINLDTVYYMPGASADFSDTLLDGAGLVMVSYFTSYGACASQPLPIVGFVTAGIDATVQAVTEDGMEPGCTPLRAVLTNGCYSVRSGLSPILSCADGI